MLRNFVEMPTRVGLSATARPHSPARAFRHLLLDAARRFIRAYQRDRQRYALSQLDARLLRDIGLTRLQAQQESAKRFWEP